MKSYLFILALLLTLNFYAFGENIEKIWQKPIGWFSIVKCSPDNKLTAFMTKTVSPRLLIRYTNNFDVLLDTIFYGERYAKDFIFSEDSDTLFFIFIEDSTIYKKTFVIKERQFIDSIAFPNSIDIIVSPKMNLCAVIKDKLRFQIYNFRVFSIFSPPFKERGEFY